MENLYVILKGELKEEKEQDSLKFTHEHEPKNKEDNGDTDQRG